MTQAAILAASGSPGTTTGFKNRIINGAMVIDQRNGGAEVNPAVNNTYYLDRWNANSSSGSVYKIQQNAGAVTPPAGFTNYLGITSLAATSVGAGDSYSVMQRIEGYNIADLAWGTANAKTITVSFWVRSSLTGTFGGSITNGALDRSYVFSYSIPSANTWTQISVTVPGDTTGTWATNNTSGLWLWFGLGMGSGYSTTPGVWQGLGYRSATGAVSVVGTSGATFYITGVQLEVGTTATNFDFRSYGTELSLCQRYFEAGYTDTVSGYISGAAASVSSWVNFSVTKRSTVVTGTFSLPSVPTFSSATGTWQTQASGGGTTNRTVGVNSSYNNGWNTIWAGSDPRGSGYWWISSEL